MAAMNDRNYHGIKYDRNQVAGDCLNKGDTFVCGDPVTGSLSKKGYTSYVELFPVPDDGEVLVFTAKSCVQTLRHGSIAVYLGIKRVLTRSREYVRDFDGRYRTQEIESYKRKAIVLYRGKTYCVSRECFYQMPVKVL